MRHRWSEIGMGSPAFYRIVVRGRLDGTWSSQLGGLDIFASGELPELPLTTLSGCLPDQAALLGVLDGLNGLGFALLLVECLAGEDTYPSPSGCTST